MCGPCSCNNSHRNSASHNNGNQSDRQTSLSTLPLSVITGVRRETVRLRVDTWWRKPTIPQKFRTNQPRPAGTLRETEKKIVEEDVVVV